MMYFPQPLACNPAPSDGIHPPNHRVFPFASDRWMTWFSDFFCWRRSLVGWCLVLPGCDGSGGLRHLAAHSHATTDRDSDRRLWARDAGLFHLENARCAKLAKTCAIYRWWSCWLANRDATACPRHGSCAPAPNAKLRSAIVPQPADNQSSPSPDLAQAPGSSAPARISWTRLPKRVLEVAEVGVVPSAGQEQGTTDCSGFRLHAPCARAIGGARSVPSRTPRYGCIQARSP